MPNALEAILTIANHDGLTIADVDLAQQPNEVVDWLRSTEILIAAAPAQHINCPQCDDGHHVLVEPMSIGRSRKFFYTCTETGTFEVSTTALQRWRIGASRFADVLAGILGTDSTAEVLVAERAWRLGTIVVGGETFSIILFRGMGREDAASVQAQAVAATPADRSIALTMDSQDEVTGTTGLAARLSLATVLISSPLGFILDRARIEQSIPRLNTVVDKPLVDSATLTVSYKGKRCKFSARAHDQFALMKCISARPNHRILFDTLRGPDGVFTEYATEDQSIRSAARRLRKTLEKANMEELARCIRTDSHEGGSMMLDLSGYGAK